MKQGEITFERKILSNGKTKEEFYRELFLDLATDRKYPEDIFDCSISGATEASSDIFEIIGEARVNYACTVGYDRKVGINGSHVNTETVTDWKPYSGEWSGEYWDITPADGDCDPLYAMEVIWKAKECGAKYVEDEAENALSPSPSQLAQAEETFVRDAKNAAEENLPGDRHKDFSASGTATVKKVINYKAPEYRAELTYNGKNHHIVGSAIPKTKAFSFESIPTKEKEDRSSSKKMLRPFLIVAAALAIAGLVAACVLAGTIGTGNAVPYLWLCIPGVAVFIAGVVYNNVVYSKKMSERQSQKLIGLQKKLSEFGLSPLTEEEKRKIHK